MADTEVDTRELSGGEQMFRHSRGQTWVDAAVVVIINGLCNNNNYRRPERSITFIALQQSLPA
ncbi:hypothetical protein J1N35_041429 [Gossypium stocksii]|uniref:Uncharacterized protein n=1 Tax=Gossypium stocksii TaxID=47602 RepID=A0A9D3ZJE5_9ROSI|nr:hypothetical protein J1N35_041429 [Gossypium stocksii]